MKDKKYTLPTMLVDVMCMICLALVLIRTFLPHIILPELDIPAMVLVSLLALLADYYLAPGAKRCWICVAAFGALTFGLLPFAGCFVGAPDALMLAVKGAVVFPSVTWLFDSMTDRISTGPVAKAAPVVSAMGLYLAAQALMGMF